MLHHLFNNVWNNGAGAGQGCLGDLRYTLPAWMLDTPFRPCLSTAGHDRCRSRDRLAKYLEGIWLSFLCRWQVFLPGLLQSEKHVCRMQGLFLVFNVHIC